MIARLAAIMLAGMSAQVFAAPPQASSDLKRAFTGTWYMQMGQKEAWNGKRFHLTSGREAECIACCVEDYDVTSRVILKPTPNAAEGILTGEYRSNFVVTRAARTDPDKEVDYAMWTIACGPHPNPSRARGYSRGSVTGSYRDGADGVVEMRWFDVDDGDYDDFKGAIMAPGVFELSLRTYRRIYRRAP